MNPAPLFLAAVLAAPGPEGVLEVGKTVRARLTGGDPPLEGRGPGRRFTLTVETDGPVTIALESLDLDGFLRIETANGQLVVEDDDGGVETNARAVLDAKAGSAYRIIAAAAAEGLAGELTISVAPGDVPRPEGATLSEAAAVFRSRSAERAIRRGDRKTAAFHRHREGEVLRHLSRFGEARAALEASIALARESSDRTVEAMAMTTLGKVLETLGDHEAARGLLEKALAAFRDLGHREAEAKVLLDLGQLHTAMRDFPEAREKYDACLALVRESGNRLMECAVLQAIGNLLHWMSDYPGAIEHIEKSLALAMDLPDYPGFQGSALALLGVVLAARGDFRKACERYEEALEIDRKLGDRSGEAATLGNLATARFRLGELEKARDDYERSLALAREVGNRSVAQNAVGNLGMVFRALGDYRGAQEHNETYVELSRMLGDRLALANGLGNVAVVRMDLGDYPGALEALRESLSLHRELGHRAGEVFALGNLGYLHRALGHHGGAKDATEEALRIARDVGDRLAEAQTLLNLAALQELLGDVSRARELTEEALAVARATGNREAEIFSLHNLGIFAEGEEAIRLKEEALALARSLGVRHMEAGFLSNLAADHCGAGRWKEARSLAEESLRLFKEAGIEERSLLPLRTLARLALRDGEVSRADDLLRQATRLLERASSSGLDIPEAAGLRSEYPGWDRIASDVTALRLVAAGGAGAERASIIAEGFREASRWKGRALLEGIAEHRQGGRTREAIQLRGEWKNALSRREKVLERTSEAVRSGKATEEIEALRSKARALLDEAEDLLERLREASPGDAEIAAPSGAEPGEVGKAALDEGTALVDYAAGETRIYAYVLTPEDLHFIDLGERGSLEREAEDFVSLVAFQRSLGSAEAIAEAGKSLHDRLLAPALERVGKDVKRLVIVPTASLAAFPFEALVTGLIGGNKPRDFGDIEFVLDRYTVTHAPSSAVLVEVARLGARKERGKTLVLADPVYPSETKDAPAPESLRGIPAPKSFRRIVKTRNEALAIARVIAGKEEPSSEALGRLAKERSGSFHSERIDLHLGMEASRERLAGDLRGFGTIHLAAHGYVDREHPGRTGIALAFEEGIEGYVTLVDALDLDLDADLVVLSACETATGAFARGEGVESLAGAFLYAGARGVIASLWQVSDRAAAETMRGFYQRAIAGKLSPAEALRQAKLALRGAKVAAPAKGKSPPKARPGERDAGHPFHWAPFIHVGLPR
jgi:CHAT domain-containing protein/Tfp pilus assembly protein PilF